MKAEQKVKCRKQTTTDMLMHFNANNPTEHKLAAEQFLLD